MRKRDLATLVIASLGAAWLATRPSAEKPESNVESTIFDSESYANLAFMRRQNDSFNDTSLSANSKRTFQLPRVHPKDTLYLAAAILGEASGETENMPYIKGVISGIFNRAENEGSIKRAILGKTTKPSGEIVYHYTPFDPRDPNYSRVMRFLDSEKARKTNPLFRDCYSLARDALNGTLIIEHPLSLATHFVVRSYDPRRFVKGSDARKYGVPSWTYKMTDDGKFVLDKDKNRIPLEPVAVAPVSNGKKAFFYEIND